MARDRIGECFDEMARGENLRENLRFLREAARDGAEAQRVAREAGGGEAIVPLLQDADPKVRKNAALLLGDLGIAGAASAVYGAYEKEQTLFVRPAYLAALKGMGAAADYEEELSARREELSALDISPEERVHVAKERRALDDLLIPLGEIRTHQFALDGEVVDFVLTTNYEQRDVTLGEASALSGEVRLVAKPHPLGVIVRARGLRPFLSIRTYRELLFPIRAKGGAVPEDPDGAASAVWDSSLPGQLSSWFSGDGPFYFRASVSGGMEMGERSRFIPRFAAGLEELSGGLLVNSASHYELEIRLVRRSAGGYAAYFKVQGLDSRRFSYRKNALPTSMHPATAALVAALAAPYLKEGARVLDPFCGIGTLLVERDLRVSAGEMFGVDIYGDAIDIARENAEAAGEEIHFVNRDFFTFEAARPFDEIITDMPARGKMDKGEADALYGRFFEKSGEVMAKGGILAIYSCEEGFVKKQLRLRGEFRLLGEHVIREKGHFKLYVIEYAG